MADFHLSTLGDLTLYRGSSSNGNGRCPEPVMGPSKGLAVCAFLATTPGGSARRSYLADLLWPHSPQDRGRQALRQAIYYVGQQIDAELFRSEDGRLALRGDVLSVDVRELEEAAAAERWRRVVELWDGPFLPEVPGDAGDEFRAWAETVRDRAEALVRQGYRSLVDEHLAAGEAEEAVARARGWTRAFPDSVDARGALVRALVRTGDRVAAYRAYESFASVGGAGAERLRRMVFRGDAPSGATPEISGAVSPEPDGDVPGDGEEERPEARWLPSSGTGRHGWLSALVSAAVAMGGLALAAVVG